jgi:hypothetical protein
MGFASLGTSLFIDGTNALLLFQIETAESKSDITELTE